MNGVHDMGGMMGFGPVCPESDEPVFHAEWERRVFALSRAAPGNWTIDTFRHAVESLPPVQYLSWSYYEKWLAVLERSLTEGGFVTAGEIDAGRQLAPPVPVQRVLAASDVERAMAKGSSAREPQGPARFQPGDGVRARNMHPPGHTRLPRYLRGRQGEIVAVHGAHVFPDSRAHGFGEDPQWLYTVRFTARELWGETHPLSDTVQADLWEPYLEPV